MWKQITAQEWVELKEGSKVKVVWHNSTYHDKNETHKGTISDMAVSWEDGKNDMKTTISECIHGDKCMAYIWNESIRHCPKSFPDGSGAYIIVDNKMANRLHENEFEDIGFGREVYAIWKCHDEEGWDREEEEPYGSLEKFIALDNGLLVNCNGVITDPKDIDASRAEFYLALKQEQTEWYVDSREAEEWGLYAEGNKPIEFVIPKNPASFPAHPSVAMKGCDWHYMQMASDDSISCYGNGVPMLVLLDRTANKPVYATYATGKAGTDCPRGVDILNALERAESDFSEKIIREKADAKEYVAEHDMLNLITKVLFQEAKKAEERFHNVLDIGCCDAEVVSHEETCFDTLIHTIKQAGLGEEYKKWHTKQEANE